jgi:DnaJ-domain-containing protein 1
MSELIFTNALIIFAGYLAGKIFKGFNPFLVAIGLLFLLAISPIFTESENEYITYAVFGFGVILNFNQPVTRLRYWLSDFGNLISLRRLATNYSNNIEQQKAEAEAELYRQKREIEEDIRRQKRQAEEEINRQRREAEEANRREAENLKREQERAEKQRRDEQRRSQQGNSQSRQSNSQNRHSSSGNSQSSQSSNRDSSHLDPTSFANACEIMGKGQGCQLAEYKAAYKKLVNQNHPDKVFARTGSKAEKEKAEKKTKQLNVAWETIKKKLT